MFDKKAYDKAYRAANRDKLKAYDKAYYKTNKDNRKVYNETNKEGTKAYYEAYYEANKESCLLRGKENKKQNREANLAKGREWYRANQKKVAEKSARYFERRLQAAPNWADIDKMAKVYLKRDELNELWDTNFQVDHIYPIRGKLVSGLHVWENLQLLDASLNQSKGNR